MTIIGFNFTKMHVEKHQAAKGKITVNRKANPVNVEEVKIGGAQKALRYDFEFSCEYEPKIAEMHFTGNVTELVTDKDSEDILGTWKKSKSLPPKTLEKVMNAILNRCHIQALVLSKEMNVPAPFNLPRVKVREAAEKA